MTDNRNDIEKVIAYEQNLRLLIDNTEDPIWLVDNNYIILECNKSFKKWVYCFIGKELDKGDHVLDNGNDKIYQDKFEMCYTLALNGRTFRTVEDMKVGDEVRYTAVSFNPVFDTNHNVIGVSCFARQPRARSVTLCFRSLPHPRNIRQQNSLRYNYQVINCNWNDRLLMLIALKGFNTLAMGNAYRN